MCSTLASSRIGLLHSAFLRYVAGFVVKAESEGQVGPSSYQRTHADAANMIARALKPHGGLVFYRGFAEYYQKNYAAAASHFELAYRLDPNLVQAEVGEALRDAILHQNQQGIALLRIQGESMPRKTGHSTSMRVQAARLRLGSRDCVAVKLLSTQIV